MNAIQEKTNWFLRFYTGKAAKEHDGYLTVFLPDGTHDTNRYWRDRSMPIVLALV